MGDRPAGEPDVRVREMGPDDWALLRDLRLAALQDAPLAFGSSYEVEAARDEAGWRDRLSWPDGARFVAEVASTAAGLAAVYLRREDRDDGQVPELVSMWVHPDHRGTSVGRLLAAAVVDWVRARGLPEVRLMVAVGNPAAERFYKKLGFTRNGYRQPMPHHLDRDEIEMTRSLAE